MRVHFIAIGGSAMHNLAIALHKKGYQVTGSPGMNMMTFIRWLSKKRTFRITLTEGKNCSFSNGKGYKIRIIIFAGNPQDRVLN